MGFLAEIGAGGVDEQRCVTLVELVSHTEHPLLTLARDPRISQSTQSRGTTHVATLGDLVTYLAHIARVR